MRGFVALLAFPALLGAQDRTPVAAFAPLIMSQQVREKLAADWDRHSHDPETPERLYCLTHNSETLLFGGTAYRVTKAERVKVANASPTRLSGACPDTAQMRLHTHPASTCDIEGKRCRFGGDDAHLCYPSQVDLRTLVSLRHPFGVVQCGRESFVGYTAVLIPAEVSSDTARRGLRPP